MIVSERLKKRLDRQQIDDICFVIDRFIEALECQIEIFHSDRCQSFGQRSNVLPRCQPAQLFDAFLSLKPVTLPRISCGQQARY